MAGDYARMIAEQAQLSGLEQAVRDAEDLRALLNAADQAKGGSSFSRQFAVYEPPRFFRTPERIRNIGVSKELHDKVFEAAENAKPGEKPILVVPVSEGTKWAIVEVEGLKPLYQGEFDSRKAQLAQQNAFLQAMDARRVWFDVANIRQRTGFVDARPPVAASEADAPADDAATAS
ncbi:MAG: hypothetical protein D6744_01370 [Planctomycetota bacterium]|nr:MAG: hypothetical protein D6744_01370 [Planctomycetota bacterium]